MDEQSAAQGPVNVVDYVAELTKRRDESISQAERITRVLDYIQAHPDCQEFLKLCEEMQEP